MFSNLKRVVTLSLLASAASSVLAAPAPVSDIGNSASTSASTASVSSGPASETDVQRLERLLENRNRTQLQMQQQLDEMSQEIRDLRGQIEKNSYDMQQMVQRQRELFVELDRVRSNMKSPAATQAATDDKADDTDSGTFSANANEQSAYQDAVDLILKKRDYTGAIAAFQKFQKDFPQSVYLPNSHYWLGQLFFAKKQDVDAAKSFAAVISYPKSNKRADALVKLGDIATRNNNAAQAKKYYQQVVDEYPSSASAELARTHLK
ncbi:tol-pal system protein YbgF [Vibrio porteresiae]|uniref:Cell division coordinator CpoB n=1 Tax=Vibrio porteresiae DSM 19223 TaxID=1123496 RepID=A0ABZ0Q9I7_9VIBR|nr:tol-pal system protein YbgF [Vibrio porteresiae]WPC73107.1 tol-pal system protein YbgF [Vibrio porteresiae DSM 19223]